MWHFPMSARKAESAMRVDRRRNCPSRIHRKIVRDEHERAVPIRKSIGGNRPMLCMEKFA